MTKIGIYKGIGFCFSFILNYLQNPFVPREGIVTIVSRRFIEFQLRANLHIFCGLALFIVSHCFIADYYFCVHFAYIVLFLLIVVENTRFTIRFTINKIVNI